jgi:hypothetical protein
MKPASHAGPTKLEFMRTIYRFALPAALALIAASWGVPARAEDSSTPSSEAATSAAGIDPAVSGAPSGASASGFERATPKPAPDPCKQPQVVAGPTRPYWDSGAATTQCGNLEMDFGWQLQPMGAGVRQQMLVSSLRYGLTPRVDLRWGVINHISQSGGGLAPLAGVGDQSVSATYHISDQRRLLPAFALGYGFEIPVGNPAKGFGSGFADHQFLFIASRDLSRIHLDFNAVGTLTGEANGHDGAVQFGLAATRTMTNKLSLILESYGGPQPGTSDRFGAAMFGGTYSLRPWLVVDGAYVRTYTAGSPRQQIIFGITTARRLSFGPIPRGSAIARLLGR